ncbi:MAG: hypothetical protein GXP58_02560 [Deltaproteobacteria bacterium]|nr:hypothetical protein [Deltaproteobacteria bacterium]
MGQITLRGLDPELEKEIRRRAKESGRSLNGVILDILYRSAGYTKGKRAKNTLVELAGGWSEQEASEFIESIQSCEQIDEEMWK